MTTYNSYGIITITASASTNTKGAYVQIVASTPYDSSRLYIMGDFGAGVTAGRLYLMDIAKGAAASETVIVSNLAIYTDGDQVGGGWTIITVDIPSGTRLSARLQCPTGSAQSSYYFHLEDRALASIANPETYGVVTASSRGTSFDPGGSANVKSAYTQLTASTGQRNDALLVCCTIESQGQGITAASWKVDIATGGAGSEVVILPDLTFRGNSLVDTIAPTFMRFPISIPSGTRLSARVSCSSIISPGRLIAISLVGMQDVTEASTGSNGPLAAAYSD